MLRLCKTLVYSFIFLFPQIVIAQEEAYRVYAEQVPFDTFIDVLEREYNVQFSYQSDLLQNESFNIKSNTPDLSDILNEITAIFPIEYQILGKKSILLRERLSKTVERAPNTIEIVILDSITRRSVEEAAIGIRGTNIGTYSDQYGKATLKVPGKLVNPKLEIHMLGYKTEHITLGGNSYVQILINPQSFSIEEVMVQDRKDILQKSRIDHSVSLNVGHLSSFVSGIMGKDVMRQAQLLPGIASFNDVSSGLQVRGGEEQSSLIIIDDIPVYNSGHYFGLFSTINPNYSTKSKLYKNNLPISHDGKTSGMLELNATPLDSNAVFNGSLDVNLLAVSGAMALPITNQLSLNLAGRTSFRNAADSDLFSLFESNNDEPILVENFSQTTRDQLLTTVPDFKFSDINGRLNYNWGKSSIALSYFRSDDDFDDTFENIFLTRRQRIIVQNEERYSNIEEWSNEGASLNASFKLNDNLNFSAIAYHTNYKNLSGVIVGLKRSFLNENFEAEYRNDRINVVKDLGVKSFLIFSNNDFEIEVGAEVVNHNIEVAITEQQDTVTTQNRSAKETSFFASFSPRLEERLNLDIGMRGTWYRNKFYPAPRINIGYDITDNIVLKAAAGRHNQYVREVSFENVFGRSLDLWHLANNRNVKVSKSNNFMIGGSWRKDRLSIDVEAYYRKTFDMLELALVVNSRMEDTVIQPNTQPNRYEFYNGDGKDIGIDVLIGYTQKKYSGWIGYTLSKSTIRYDRIAVGTTFPRQDDRRHEFKWINEYRLGNFTFGGNFIFASGRPYTDITKVAPTLRREELRPEDRISRLPDYIRTDIGLSYAFKVDKTDATIGLSAYNLLNRQNVNYIQYLFSVVSNTADAPNQNTNTLLGAESGLLDRTVNLNLSLRF